MIGKSLGAIGGAFLLAYLAWNYLALPVPDQWSEAEAALIRSLSLSELGPLPADPGNRAADSAAAAELGHHLYFDTRLSANGTISCASCHQPDRMFGDGLPLAEGMATGPRHTPGLVGASYSPWFYWDGRKDSQWAQALAPLEASHEHGSDRLSIGRLIAGEPTYRALYEQVFGALPVMPAGPPSASPRGNGEQQAAWLTLSATEQHAVNTVFANVGKSLAAYQRRLLPGPGRFDHYADSLGEQRRTEQGELLSAAELSGLALFIGKAQCVNCHNGPLLSNHEFHNTGVLSVAGQLPSMGRYDGIRSARQDPFNCLGDYSDAAAGDCIELRFARDDNSLVGAHKTPTLRNVDRTAPYMHGGQLADLAAVIEHYNDAPLSMLSHNEAKPLALRPVERRQLEAFLHTLTAPLATDPKWLHPPQ